MLSFLLNANLRSLVAYTYDVGTTSEGDASAVVSNLSLVNELTIDSVDSCCSILCTQDINSTIVELDLNILICTDCINSCWGSECDVVCMDEGNREVILRHQTNK